MAELVNLPSIPAFEIGENSTTLAERWRKWKKAFEFLIVASGITNEERKRALLMCYGGPEIQDLYETLDEIPQYSPAVPAHDGVPEIPAVLDVYATAISTLDNYFSPRKNKIYERHKVRQQVQLEGESMDTYVTRLKKLSVACEWEDKRDEELVDHIVNTCSSVSLRKKFLKIPNLTLEKILEESRAKEATDQQVADMTASPSVVNSQFNINAVKNKEKINPKTENSDRRYSSLQRSVGPCFKCGYMGHMARNCRVAQGKRCNKCHKFGHFERMCKSTMKENKNKPFVGGGDRGDRMDGTKKKNYHQNSRKNEKRGPLLCTVGEEYSSSSEDEYAFQLQDSARLNKSMETYPIMIAKVKIPMLIDSGSSVNIISMKYWKMIKDRGLVLKPCCNPATAYGAELPLETLGIIHVDIATNEAKLMNVKFHVIQGNNIPLLSRESAIKLGLLWVKSHVNSVDDANNQWKVKYKNCFKGIGKLKDFQLKIHIDKDVKPVAQPLRRVPFSLAKAVDSKIQELLDNDIIEAVNGPTPWVSPLVVIPKHNSDQVRVCVDMRRANEAVIRERHPIPTIDDILLDLNGASVFSKLDLKWGFHQIELDLPSREITTFVTNRGLFRYKRLLFGVSCAPECYQHVIHQVLEGCPGTHNISDDIIVYGRDQAEHDKRLDLVFQRLSSRGLTVNPEKCKFNMTELTFMGHVLSGKGIAPQQSKKEAVLRTKVPETPSDVRSFMGLVNFCARFVPDLATIAEPLRTLTRSKTEWEWTEKHQNAFDELKMRLASAETMAYYNRELETKIIVDASPIGLGAILVQKHGDHFKPVYYASRTLTDVEKKYSQTEKEALAVVWGCERFNIYLAGKEFVLVTDHKPLECIYSAKSKPPARIERWLLRLQPYRFKVEYKPGKYNPADVLSRAPLDEQSGKDNKAEEYAYFIASHAVPSALTEAEVIEETRKDPKLCQIMKAIKTGNWESCDSAFRKIYHELFIVKNMVMRDTRIVVPVSLQKKILRLAHEGHMGIVKTKQRLRTKVWWPGIDKEIEQVVRQCHACQLVSTQSEKSEPIISTEMPSGPWEILGVDLCGPFPTGDNLLVIVDYYSRWQEVVIIKSTTADVIIDKLQTVFSTHGLPVTIVTDNGPQFKSQDFKNFVKEYGINHRKVTPYWPQANGEVERQNRILLKTIRTAKAEGKDWKKELRKFLLVHRSTPHTSTGVAPCMLLFGRQIRTKLDISIPQNSKLVNERKVRKKDAATKSKIKENVDKIRKSKYSDVKVDDLVLLRQPHVNKFSTTFEEIPYKILERKGNSVVIESTSGNGAKLCRNISDVRKFVKSEKKLNFVNESEDESDSDMNIPTDVEMTDAQNNSEQPNVEEQEEQIEPRPQRPTRNRRLPRYLNDYNVYALP